MNRLLEIDLELSNQGALYPCKCDVCGCGMMDGFIYGGGAFYFCSDECLHTCFTDDEYNAQYSDDDVDCAFYTEWYDMPDDELYYERLPKAAETRAAIAKTRAAIANYCSATAYQAAEKYGEPVITLDKLYLQYGIQCATLDRIQAVEAYNQELNQED